MTLCFDYFYKCDVKISSTFVKDNTDNAAADVKVLIDEIMNDYDADKASEEVNHIPSYYPYDRCIEFLQNC